MINPYFRSTQGTNSASNVFVTWTTGRLAHRPAAFCGGWWGVVDAIGHKLNLPDRVMRPICDHYDIAVGIPKADLIRMDYNGIAPWWLR